MSNLSRTTQPSSDLSLLPQIAAEPINRNERAELFEELGLTELALATRHGERIVLTGHQPTFHHPGIVSKTILAARIAESSPTIHAVDLVLDSDSDPLPFRYPTIGAQRRPRQELFELGDGQIAFAQQSLDDERRAAFLLQLDEHRRELYALFTPSAAMRIAAELDCLRDFAVSAQRPCDIALEHKRSWERRHNLTLARVDASRLVECRPFRRFVASIRNDAAGFRRAYNQTLDDYRRDHQIRNHAQPLPNLHAGELPFWLVEDGYRNPLLESHQIDDTTLIYPRAVTLTLFLRLYLTDLMIHGTGGGRYDAITDRLLSDYFGQAAAPWCVTTATLALEARADYPLPLSDDPERHHAELLARRRKLLYDPLALIEHSDLSQRRAAAIEEWQRLRRLAPDERGATWAVRLSKLHEEFVALRQAARESPSAKSEWKRVSDEIERHRRAGKSAELFARRDFPFLYYDCDGLLKRPLSRSLAIACS